MAAAKSVEVEVLHPLKSGGKRHDVGDTLTLPQDVAEDLEAAGTVLPKAAGKKAKADAEAKAKADAEAKAKADAEANPPA